MDPSLFTRRKATLDELRRGEEEMRQEAQRLQAEDVQGGPEKEWPAEDADQKLEKLLHEQKGFEEQGEAEQRDLEDAPKSIGGSTKLRTPSKPQDEEGKGRMWPGGPRGLPTPLGLEPPLFDEQQFQRMRDLEKKAMLMKREVEFAMPWKICSRLGG